MVEFCHDTVDGREILHHRRDGWNSLMGCKSHQLVQDFQKPPEISRSFPQDEVESECILSRKAQLLGAGDYYCWLIDSIADFYFDTARPSKCF